MEQVSGQRLLCAKLRLGGGQLSTREFAAEVGAHSGLVSRWSRGLARPGVVARKLMAAKFGIPEDTWLSSQERAALQALVVVRDEDVPQYDPAVDEPSPEEVAS